MDHRLRFRLVVGLLAAFALHGADLARGTEPSPEAKSALLTLHAQTRVETKPGSGEFNAVTRPLEWEPSRTAIVVCDMWNEHWCKGATRRVAEMAPRMNDVLVAARKRGVLIIHCPSDTMKYYEGTAQRERARRAPHVATRACSKRAAASMASAKAVCRSTIPTAAAIAIPPASRAAPGPTRSRR